MKENDLKIVKKKITDLIPAEYNPKKLSASQKAQLRASIERFGLVDPIIINTHKDRKNIIVGGHQRVKVALEMGFEEMPCVEVNLPLEKEKELNIRLSKNTGSIDDANFAMNFTKDLLLEVGFKENELNMFMSDFEQKFNSIDDLSCQYPLVPKFSEKHDCIIIISNNEIDTAFLETSLNIGTAQSYKNSHTGKAMVIDINQFKKAWESKSK